MPYPIELRERVLGAIDEGMSKWKAHQTFKVSRSTINDWLKLHEETGSLKANTSYRRGPKPAIKDTAENRAFFEEHKYKTLEQMRKTWFEKTGVWLSDVTMSKTLKRFGYTRKKKSYLYKERNEVKRQGYLEKLKKFKAEDCVYIDEAGMDDRLDYAYGWSQQGTRCFAEKLGHATQRISMIAAYCQKKVFAPMTFSGYCNSQLVESWFEQVLLPQLKPNQVVILDNASFHRKAELEALLDTVDCHLLPLSPYSPDLNKIEHIWQKIKSIVRKNDNDDLSFHDKIDAAFCSF